MNPGTSRQRRSRYEMQQYPWLPRMPMRTGESHEGHDQSPERKSSELLSVEPDWKACSGDFAVSVRLFLVPTVRLHFHRPVSSNFSMMPNECPCFILLPAAGTKQVSIRGVLLRRRKKTYRSCYNCLQIDSSFYKKHSGFFAPGWNLQSPASATWDWPSKHPAHTPNVGTNEDTFLQNFIPMHHGHSVRLCMWSAGSTTSYRALWRDRLRSVGP